MSVDQERRVRVKLRDDLYERLLTRAAQIAVEPEVLARTLLERAIRRLPVSTRAA